jgi:hypothetical protein
MTPVISPCSTIGSHYSDAGEFHGGPGRRHRPQLRFGSLTVPILPTSGTTWALDASGASRHQPSRASSVRLLSVNVGLPRDVRWRDRIVRTAISRHSCSSWDRSSVDIRDLLERYDTGT